MTYDLIIIGFGLSGIACARYAKKNNLKYLVLEKNSSFGGVWNTTYDYTKLQTHKMFYQFSELNHDKKTPDYPEKHHLLEYFNLYVDKFNLNKNVKYSETVVNVKYNERDKHWSIITDKNLYTTKYVAICSGFFAEKNDIPFIEKGDYTKVNRKLVVGNGASATDYLKNIYSKDGFLNTEYDLIYNRDKYYLNFLSRNLPVSITINPLYLTFFKKLPLYIFHKCFHFFFTFNKKIPNEKINYTNIVKNDFIYFLETIGKLNIYKTKIKSVDGNKVTFENNTTKEYDEIINMAGYKRSINFLDDKINDINNELGYNYCLPRDIEKYPNLSFIGFAPSYNWIMVSEAQSKWYTECIKNNSFPNCKDRSDFIREETKKKNKNQSFNDLTYISLQFAKDLGISNKSLDRILAVFSVNNFYLVLLIISMGVTLLMLKDYPLVISIVFTLLIIIYLKKLDLPWKRKKRIIIACVLFSLYGTLTESLIISNTGVLNYSQRVKISNKLNFPLFLPLVYFFWGLIVTRLNNTLNSV